jgi:photosystem II stability/assembly factor-like uncharacterized protein
MNTLVVLTVFDSAKNRMIAVYRLMRSIWIVLALLFSFQIISKVDAEEWELIGFSDKPVVAIGIHPSDPQILYAIAGDTLYKTVNGGSDWSALLFLHNQGGIFICRERGIVINPLFPDIIYAYGDTMILKSINSGSTWVNISEGLQFWPEHNHSMCYLAINSTNTNVLYASTYSITGGFFFIYLDDSWQEIFVTDIFVVIDFASDTLMYAGAGGLFPGTVLKSTDGGWTWEPTEFPHDNFGIMDLCVNPNLNQHLLVATTDSGVYKTMDGGLTWEQCNTGLTSLKLSRVAIDPDSSNVAYVGSKTDGVFLSRDYGTIWETINDGLEHLSIHCLGVGPSGTATLYAGTGSGLWKYSRVTGIKEGSNIRGNLGKLLILKIEPNPFVVATQISYSIPFSDASGIVNNSATPMNLKIFSITGQLVKTLVNTGQTPGRYSIIWNGRDQVGKSVKSGLYFCRLCIGDFSKVAKIIYLR